MGYKADFRNASERKLVNMAWELSGLSQGAFTRVVLLREALRLAELAQVKGTDNGITAEENPNAAVSGEAGSEGTDGGMVADAAPTNDSQG